MSNRRDHVTALLVELSRSNRTAVDALLPLVYDELRGLAHRQLRNQRAGHTLQTTALVHEAYLKLIHRDRATWESRAHFLSVAAIAMRQILINYARERRAAKRGGGQALATFNDELMGDEAIELRRERVEVAPGDALDPPIDREAIALTVGEDGVPEHGRWVGRTSGLPTAATAGRCPPRVRRSALLRLLASLLGSTPLVVPSHELRSTARVSQLLRPSFGVRQAP